MMAIRSNIAAVRGILLRQPRAGATQNGVMANRRPISLSKFVRCERSLRLRTPPPAWTAFTSGRATSGSGQTEQFTKIILYSVEFGRGNGYMAGKSGVLTQWHGVTAGVVSSCSRPAATAVARCLSRLARGRLAELATASSPGAAFC